MSDERALEDLLRDPNSPLFRDDAGEPHLSDASLEAHVRAHRAFTAEELAHVAACAECRSVVGVLHASDSADVVVLERRKLMLGGGFIAMALAASLVFFVLPSAPPSELASKGQTEALAAEVALIATSADGRRRDLGSGESVRLDERIGFKYGNPEGAHQTLTVLGWDGRDLHWYYPESPQSPPTSIDGGPRALSVRLPFDIKLSEKHQTGALTIVAAFDAEPKVLAEQLGRGQVPEAKKGTHVFRLRVEATP